MKNNLKYFTILFLLLPLLGQAQSTPETFKVFDIYGNMNGATLVEMQKEMLKSYDFSYYKSLVLTKDKGAGYYARRCLEIDQKGAKKVKQITSNGVLSTVYLQLSPQRGLNRLILFNETNQPHYKMTLIYIESKKEMDELLNIILKRK